MMDYAKKWLYVDSQGEEDVVHGDCLLMKWMVITLLLQIIKNKYDVLFGSLSRGGDNKHT